jgi:hypothetical protein
MGSDNLFHKRKAKANADTQRRKAKRDAYAKVLIVCEGEKTEPLYFSELVDHYEIHSANVRVTGACGSDPLSVVNYANQLYEYELSAGSGPFDRVYCVFDRDAHTTYQAALTKIAVYKPKGTFFPITSVPCFEYWLLLHYTNTTAPFMPTGTTSAGATVLKHLQTYWPTYNKAAHGTFAHTLQISNDDLSLAKANANRALSQSKQHHDDNPSTQVHELVDYLQNIKKDCTT